MALDFSKAIKSVEASINKYLIKGQAIPTNSLSYYNDLRTANGSAGGNSGGGGTTNGPNTPTVYEGILEPNYYNVLLTTAPPKKLFQVILLFLIFLFKIMEVIIFILRPSQLTVDLL